MTITSNISTVTVNPITTTCTVQGINGDYHVFENLNIGTVTRSGNTYTLTFGTNSGKMWFHIRLCKLKGQNLTFIMKDVRSDHWKSNTYVVVSHDKWNWTKINGTLSGCYIGGSACGGESKCCNFTWAYTPQYDEEYISFPYPYSNWQLYSFLDANSTNPYLYVNTMTSTEGRNQKLLTISENPIIYDANKYVVYLIAREDAWETAGTHAMMGGIKYLLSNDARAIQIRKNIIFKIVPIMPVDYVYKGWSTNLKTCWMSNGVCPTPFPKEVQNIKDYIIQWKNSGKRIDLNGRYHSWGFYGSGGGVYDAENYPALKSKIAIRLGPYNFAPMKLSSPGQGRFYDFLNSLYGNVPGFSWEIRLPNNDIVSIENLGKVMILAIADYFNIS